MVLQTLDLDGIHQRALEAATDYHCAEDELIDVIQVVDQNRLFVQWGYSSTYSYVTRELRLSEDIAITFIAIARKACAIPALKSGIRDGSITLSNAKRILPVLEPENQTEWLKKAENLTFRQLSKEVVRVKPEEATVERASYVAENRIRLELGLSEESFQQFQRAQDLLCQRVGKAMSFEETLKEITVEFLRRNDPVEIAERRQSKLVKTPVTSPERGIAGVREPVPAEVRHQVNLRDRGKCQYQDQRGNKCLQGRWVEIHHIRPVSLGGRSVVENLITLCSAHHERVHLSGYGGVGPASSPEANTH